MWSAQNRQILMENRLSVGARGEEVAEEGWWPPGMGLGTRVFYIRPWWWLQSPVKRLMSVYHEWVNSTEYEVNLCKAVQQKWKRELESGAGGELGCRQGAWSCEALDSSESSGFSGVRGSRKSRRLTSGSEDVQEMWRADRQRGPADGGFCGGNLGRMDTIRTPDGEAWLIEVEGKENRNPGFPLRKQSSRRTSIGKTDLGASLHICLKRPLCCQ